MIDLSAHASTYAGTRPVSRANVLRTLPGSDLGAENRLPEWLAAIAR